MLTHLVVSHRTDGSALACCVSRSTAVGGTINVSLWGLVTAAFITAAKDGGTWNALVVVLY